MTKESQSLPSQPGDEVEGITPDLLAAIVAAASVTLRKRLVVTRIRYYRGTPENAWAKLGRFSWCAK